MSMLVASPVGAQSESFVFSPLPTNIAADVHRVEAPPIRPAEPEEWHQQLSVRCLTVSIHAPSETFSEATAQAISKGNFLEPYSSLVALNPQQAPLRHGFPRVISVASPENLRPSNHREGTRAHELLYINGMRITRDALAAHISYLAVCFGMDITAVVNEPEAPLFPYDSGGFTTALRNAVLGVLSPNWGIRVEPTAVLTAARHIEKVVLHDERPLEIVAHSQGSIILANALEFLLGNGSRLTDTEKNLIRERLSVFTFGAGEHSFPAGVSVIECAHAEDIVPRITAGFTAAREFFRGLGFSLVRSLHSWYRSSTTQDALTQHYNSCRAPVVILHGTHAVRQYLENLHLFLIERSRAPDGALDSASLAESTVDSILKGRVGDPIHARLISNRIDSSDQSFCAALLSHCSSIGAIGNFMVPRFQELLKLGGLAKSISS